MLIQQQEELTLCIGPTPSKLARILGIIGFSFF
jgi:hypothetical protein